jgi:hypothetical protein
LPAFFCCNAGVVAANGAHSAGELATPRVNALREKAELAATPCALAAALSAASMTDCALKLVEKPESNYKI